MYKKGLKIDRSRFISDTKFSKKGQVTIFIILGIVLLIAITLFILFKQEIVTFKPEQLPTTEKGKVEQYLTSCMDTLGNEALFLIGQQGGYVEVPSSISTDGSQHLRVSPFLVVPFWAIGPATSIPSLDLIKQEIDEHIQTNLRTCVLGLEPFQETYDISEKSEITSDTKILDNKVAFNVHWELEVKTKDGEVITTIADHTSESPIKLKNAYETAQQIVTQEMQTLKLEDLTQDLIALEHKNLPVAGVEMSCTRKEWNAQTAKDTLKDLLRVNLRQLKIKGTEFVEFPEELPYYQNHYIWNIGDNFTRQDMSVSFKYDNNYPFTFQVTPLDGNKMRSGIVGGSSALSYLCIQIWKFTYDVSYPVMITIQDDTTGYNFNTALTVHLIRNMPNRNVPLTARPGGSLDLPTDEKYCNNRYVPMSVLTWSLLDNPEQGIHDLQPLEDVNLSLTCLKYRCDLGQTEFDFAHSGYQAGKAINFPYCVGGILRGEKPGYKEDWKRVVTKDGEQVELQLVPLFKFPASGFKVVQHEFKGNDEPLGQAQPLDPKDTVLIRLTSYKNGEQYHQLEQVLGGKTDSDVIRRSSVDFLQGADYEYKVEVNVFDEEKLIGGYAQNWTIPWTQLETGTEITFHALNNAATSEEELYQFILGLEENSKRIPAPEIK